MAKSANTFTEFLAQVALQKKTLEHHEQMADVQAAGATILNPTTRALAGLTQISRDLLNRQPGPDNISPKNRKFAQAAERAVMYYAFTQQMDPFTAAGVDSPLYDILGDMMHLSHQNGFDLDLLYQGVKEDKFLPDLENPDFEDDEIMPRDILPTGRGVFEGGRPAFTGTVDFEIKFEVLGHTVTRKARLDYEHIPEWPYYDIETGEEVVSTFTSTMGLQILAVPDPSQDFEVPEDAEPSWIKCADLLEDDVFSEEITVALWDAIDLDAKRQDEKNRG